MYPKWEAYRRLASTVPAEHLSLHVLCQDADQARRAWRRVATAQGRAGVRTDLPGGGVGLPFAYRATFDEAIGLIERWGQRYVYLLAQPVDAKINGKALRLDDDTVLVEWGTCETARDFDAGRCHAEHAIVGTWPHAVWGEQVVACVAPSMQPRHLQTLYRIFLQSGLTESAWSYTTDERIILWG